MARTVYGRAYPITQADAKAYRRVDKRSLKANPIGVTAMAAVNGRGSFKSARAVAQGKSRGQRLARARQVYGNGGVKMAGILKNRTTKRKSTSRKKSSSKTSRRRVPGTNFYSVGGGRYQNAKGAFVKASRVAAAKKRKSTARKSTATRKTTRKTTARKAPARKRTTKRTTSRRRVRRNASVGASSSYSAGYDRMRRSAAAKKAAATRKRRAAAKKAAATRKRKSPAKRKSTTTRARRVGSYTRIRAKDPKTGRSKLSYMYRTKSGKRRKIPTSAITRSGHKTAAEVKRGRAKAAKRIKKEGSAFVANKRKSAKQVRAGKRLAAYMAARRQGKSVKTSKASALRKVPLRRGDSFKGTAKAPVTVSRGSKKTRVKRNRRRSPTKRKRTTAKRRRTTKRNNATMPNRRRRRTAAKRVRKNPSRRRKTTARRRVRKNSKSRVRSALRKRRTRRVSAKRRPVAKNRRRTRKNRRSMRRRASSMRRGYRKNAFMANLKQALATGLFVTGGYFAHRVFTNLLCNTALSTVGAGDPTMAEWKKPLVGFGVLAIGLPVAGFVAKKRAIEIGAGMVASWLQSTIVAALNTAGQPNLAQHLGGYSNSRAYSLRGNRRRRRRGAGQYERHASSIGPRYTPVSGLGWQQAFAGPGWQQAAAGQFAQAAAGEYFQATGEYFQSNGVGEYFAAPGVKGVGSYEPAGQLAMQASAGTQQIVRDGLRPDSDLDNALDIAEAAAGLGNPVAVERRVPRKSTWIPGGPLWAGEMPVTATMPTSEISAGILQRPGGNGILSGG